MTIAGTNLEIRREKISAVVDSIVSTALPIFTSSAVSAVAVLFNVATVGRHDKSALYYLALFLPIYYVVLAIQEGLRVPILRKAAAARETGGITEFGEYLGLVLALFVAGTLSVITVYWIASDFLADLYNVPEADRRQISIFIYCLLGAGLFPGLATMTLSALFGLGRGMIAGVLGIVATGVNVAVAYFSAVYFDQGIFSLVWAAIIGGTCLLLPGFLLLVFQQRVTPTFPVSAGSFKGKLADIASLSVPVSLSFLAIFGFLFIFNHLVAYYGAAEVAGFGVAFRIQSFVILPAIALGTALAILINGAVASGRFTLIPRYFHTGLALSFAIYAAVAAIIYVFQESLLSLFSTDPEEIAAGMRYLSLVAPSYLSFGPVLVLLTLLEQTGYGFRAMLVNVVFFALELGFASILGLQLATSSTLYLVVAAGNWLALGYLAFEVIHRATRSKRRASPTQHMQL